MPREKKTKLGLFRRKKPKEDTPAKKKTEKRRYLTAEGWKRRQKKENP